MPPETIIYEPVISRNLGMLALAGIEADFCNENLLNTYFEAVVEIYEFCNVHTAPTSEYQKNSLIVLSVSLNSRLCLRSL